MNIEQAKAIPLALILDKLGCRPAKEKTGEAWYLSPLRGERTASLHVKTAQNIWYDFGEGKGGNNLAFVCAWLKSKGEDDTIADALRWLRNMIGTPLSCQAVPVPEIKEGKEERWTFKRSKPLEHLALIRYLRSRGIDPEVARRHLSEVYVRNGDNTKGLFALGIKNEEGGYELRNPFFKGSVAPKAITFIRAADAGKPKAVSIFEGCFDYLTIATIHPEMIAGHDCISLNSLSMLGQALPYLKGYGYETLHSWMDNDPAGRKAAALLDQFVKSEPGLRHKPMNNLYSPHKDVNAWHRHNLNLSL